MLIGKLRVNHVENPIGFLTEPVTLSWIVQDAKGDKAAKARVEISTDPGFRDCIFDSGVREDMDSLGYCPDFKTEEETRYYWRVSVWDDAGDCGVSQYAYFETAAKIKQAKWIQAPFDQKIHPLFRKKLTITSQIKSARLYISGLGLYEAYINGEKVGDEYLTPYDNDYNLWIQYQTYDVTGQLVKGENVLGAMLGNGWYKGRFGFVDKLDSLYGDSFGLICELHIVYEDGTKEIISSDESWLCAPSPVMESSIYDGEIWDARRETDDWAGIGCSEENFVHAVEAEKPEGKLTERISVPLKIMEKIKPVELIHTNAGEQVIDFGQNMTGWVEFVCREPRDREISLQFGEILQGGNFYNENLRTAKEEFRYISNGKETIVRPHFTFYGFRYMKVTGIENISLDDFTGCVLYSEMEQCGKVTTSDSRINRLFLNALWGQKGNFLDTPTDCPQRDERMGWTGDAEAFCQTACYNMYTPAFYRKFLYDMRLEQDLMGGAVPHVVPDVLGQIDRVLLAREGKTSDNFAVSSQHSSCAWADAATIIPWKVYLTFGDKELLREQYKNMKEWTDRIRQIDVEKCGGRYLWMDGFHFADWLALDNYHEGNFGATDPYYVASVYYYYSASLTAKAARVLELEEDAVYYADMAEKVKAAIQKEFFTPTGRIAVWTQTAMVLALQFDLVPEEFRGRLINELEIKLQDDNMHLTTGFVGTQYLCPVLADNGLIKDAYTLLLNDDYPSWLYEVSMGATTVWERWNSVLPDGSISDTGMNSLNHYAYGAIAEWLYRYMCGVSCCEDGAGFRHFKVKPFTDERFEWASMEYESAKGTIKSSWEKTEDGYLFKVEVPFDSEAEFELTVDASEVTVNGNDAKEMLNNKGMHLTKGKYEIHAVCH